MGSLTRRLDRWQSNGLITDTQKADILAFEQAQRGNVFARKIKSVALFAITLGILSIVAANWQDIPPSAKIGLHFLLNAAMAFFIIKTDPVAHPYKRDFFVCALFGLTLTFIALIGQVYQLHGELPLTLAFWVAICTPFVLYWGRTYIAINLWVAVFLASLWINVIDLSLFGKFWPLVYTVIAVNLPPLFLYAARSPWLRARKPDFAATAERHGVGMPALFACAALVLAPFHGQFLDPGWSLDEILLIAAGASVIFHAFAFHPWAGGQNNYLLFSYVLISSLLCLLPGLLLAHLPSTVSALILIAYLLYVAWFASRGDQPRLLDLCITFVMLRLFVLFLEIFGSLMLQGAGMIVSGILLIAAIKFAPRVKALMKKAVKA